MTELTTSISNHYGISKLLDRVLDGLRQAGKNIDDLEVDDLAPVDAFHTRGRESTMELASLASLDSSHQVLDVGCGIGGSARYLSKQVGCHVTGLDLTPEYIEVANRLTEMVGLEESVRFVQGSALDLPFDDASFDVVWTEHAQMNIPHKQQFYNEIGRVLKPGGHLLFHDIFRGAGPPLQFPVPWAERPEISFLAEVAEAQEFLRQAGLSTIHWHNKDADSLAFFEQVLQRIGEAGPPPIGIHLLMGDSARSKLENYMLNLTENRISVALGLAEKSIDEDHDR